MEEWGHLNCSPNSATVLAEWYLVLVFALTCVCTDKYTCRCTSSEIDKNTLESSSLVDAHHDAVLVEITLSRNVQSIWEEKINVHGFTNSLSKVKKAVPSFTYNRYPVEVAAQIIRNWQPKVQEMEILWNHFTLTLRKICHTSVWRITLYTRGMSYAVI